MIFNKIKKMANKVFSSKTYMLLAINKFVPEEFGKVVDIDVNRDEKEIFVKLDSNKNEQGNLKIVKYSIIYEGTQAYLTYNKIESEGYLKPILKKAKIGKKVKIDPKYIKIVQKMV